MGDANTETWRNRAKHYQQVANEACTEVQRLRAEVDALTLRLTGGGKTFAQLLGDEPYTVEQVVAGVMRFYELSDNGVRACMIGMLRERDQRIADLEAALHMVKANRQCASKTCETIADAALNKKRAK